MKIALASDHDPHVHIIHGDNGEYTIDLVNHIAGQAKQRGITDVKKPEAWCVDL